MAQAIVSESMRRKAKALATQSDTWARGRAKDGTGFYIIPSSDNPLTGHRVNRHGCTCDSYRHRGQCSHREAVVIVEREQAREITNRHRQLSAQEIHEAARAAFKRWNEED